MNKLYKPPVVFDTTPVAGTCGLSFNNKKRDSRIKETTRGLPGAHVRTMEWCSHGFMSKWSRPLVRVGRGGG